MSPQSSTHFVRRHRWLLTGIVLVVALTAFASVPRVGWRLHVIALQLTGRIPDISLRDTIAFMMPGSDQGLEPLIETRNPHAVIRNLHTSANDVAAGGVLFRQQCGTCHGPDGSGGPAAPRLTDVALKHGESDWAIYRTIRDGVAGTAMKSHGYSPEQLWDLVGFIRSNDSTDLARSGASIQAAGKASFAALDYEELANVHEPSEEWLTYSGSYSSTRHSTLTQINTQSVGTLALKWMHTFEADSVPIEASPLVRDGVMFLTVNPDKVIALDAHTGRQVWSYHWRASPGAVLGEFGIYLNRGVALMGDTVYVGTSDAHLIALSAATGALRWQAQIADRRTNFVSGAPIAYKDLVVIGIGQRAGRASVVAFDAATGKERWRFYSIPGQNERGNDTWGGDSWRNGGAPTWMNGSYDAKRDLLFWGTGNPKPDFDNSARRGDNLYSDCVVALRGSTGELVWYFQFTPADNHDWDSAQIPVLAEQGGQSLLLFANRNGFYYVLDRDSGKFRHAEAFVRQNWTQGIDANGRPVLPRSAQDPSGELIYPGNAGATNWWSPSYDPDLNLIYVPVLEQGMVYFPSFKSPPDASNRSFYTAVRALDATTGKRVWQFARDPRQVDNTIGGLLSTRGGVVFGSDQGTFFALNAKDGSVLWSLATGSPIKSAPVTYAVDGKQFVVITAGPNLMVFGLP